MAHTISEREHRRIERLVRKNDLQKVFSLIADMGENLNIKKSLLLGSRGHQLIRVYGFMSAAKLLCELYSLDALFNESAIATNSIRTEKRNDEFSKQVESAVLGPIHRHYPTSWPSLCLLKNHSFCDGGIINAHSIQEAQLRKLAKNGKLYQINHLRDGTFGLPKVELKGINEITTFNGFCKKHDSEIFRPIETKPFSGESEQLFLYHFRAFSFDYYTRIGLAEYYKSVGEDLIKNGFENQLNFLKQIYIINNRDIYELEDGKITYEEKLKSKDFSSISGCWIRGAGIPGIVCTAFFIPHMDLLKRRFPNRASANLSNWVSLTLTYEGGSPLVILAGRSGSPLLDQMLDSVRKTDSNSLPAEICRLALACTDNVIFTPSWWESLHAREQRAACLTNITKFNSSYFKGSCNWSLGTTTFF